LEFWVRINQFSPLTLLIGHWETSPDTYSQSGSFEVDENGFVSWLYWNGANQVVKSSRNFPLNQWIHIAVSVDESRVIRLYVGGVLSGIDRVNGPVYYSPSLSMGQFAGGPTKAAEFACVRVVTGVSLYTSQTIPVSNKPLLPANIGTTRLLLRTIRHV
jgi:hypothetical protein